MRRSKRSVARTCTLDRCAGSTACPMRASCGLKTLPAILWFLRTAALPRRADSDADFGAPHPLPSRKITPHTRHCQLTMPAGELAHERSAVAGVSPMMGTRSYLDRTRFLRCKLHAQSQSCAARTCARLDRARRATVSIVGTKPGSGPRSLRTCGRWMMPETHSPRSL